MKFKMRIERLDNFLKLLARLAFLSLLIFESLNWFGILHHQLDFTWLGLVITVGVVWVGLEMISWYLRHSTNRGLSGIIYLLAFLMILLDALGDINHLYSRFTWYDQLAHFVGGGAVGGIIISIYNHLARTGKIVLGKFGRLVSALGVTVLLGVFYELEEYLEDVITGSHRLGDGFDTANDLLLNFLGALLIITIITIFRKERGNLRLF